MFLWVKLFIGSNKLYLLMICAYQRFFLIFVGGVVVDNTEQQKS